VGISSSPEPPEAKKMWPRDGREDALIVAGSKRCVGLKILERSI
jgi:hypothetical protein